MAIKRDYSRYDTAIFRYTNLAEFLSIPIRNGIHSIFYGSVPVDVHFVDREAQTTIVLFHSAVEHSTVTLPFFSGGNLTEDLDANLLFISDPVIDLNTNIGWFTGNTNRPLQRDLFSVLSHIRRTGPMIFFGSSAGGFAALFYSHAFRNSLAVVSNPQTDIAKFYQPHIQKYLSTVWPGMTLDELPVTTSVLPLYASSFPNFVAYVQNQSDSLHVSDHMKPFFKATEHFASHRQAILGNWGDGHTPAPVTYLHGILSWALSCSGKWNEFFADEEFSSSVF